MPCVDKMSIQMLKTKTPLAVKAKVKTQNKQKANTSQAINSKTTTISSELRKNANDFLNSYENNTSNLAELVNMLKTTQSHTQLLHTLEVVFKNLLKRGDLVPTTLNAANNNENPFHAEFNTQYEKTWEWLLKHIESESKTDSNAALTTSMSLLSAESKMISVDEESKQTLSVKRLRSIVQALISPNKSSPSAIEQFRSYAQYLDILEHTWHILSVTGSAKKFANTTYALNYMAVINVMDFSSNSVLQSTAYFGSPPTAETSFNYERTRSYVNKTWNGLMRWCEGLGEPVHRQLLIVLLERFLPHLSNPVLLTDFLMDSLNHGGAISLLALHGIFTLMQKHNITYPDVYEKLYTMFEPEVFHTKYKPRLFYLADIFLSSTHLPENLVAAFLKRVARLSLVAPPQDAIIIIYFIGNLLLRHPGLKRLVCASMPATVKSDPFVMEESDPSKSKAVDSSLWELILLQKQALPSVVSAARLVFGTLPAKEFNMSDILEVKESDIFDEETTKKLKQFALSYERPSGMFLSENDKLKKYWTLV